MESNELSYAEVCKTTYELAEAIVTKWGNATNTPFGKISRHYDRREGYVFVIQWYRGEDNPSSRASVSLHKSYAETGTSQASLDKVLEAGERLKILSQHLAGHDFLHKVAGSIATLKRVQRAIEADKHPDELFAVAYRNGSDGTYSEWMIQEREIASLGYAKEVARRFREDNPASDGWKAHVAIIDRNGNGQVVGDYL